MLNHVLDWMVANATTVYLFLGALLAACLAHAITTNWDRIRTAIARMRVTAYFSYESGHGRHAVARGYVGVVR